MPEIKASRMIFELEQLVAECIKQAEDDDDEAAHITEKKIWLKALECLAEDANEPWKSVAEAALQTDHIEFARWYA